MIKKIIYGIIPYYFAKIANPESENLKYYKYIMQHGYARHLYEFKDEYTNMDVKVQKDEQNNLYFTMLDNKRLYFKRGLLPEKIQVLYKALAMEQDIRSAHHYLDNIQEVKNKTFVDVGCAEGFTSLFVIEEVNHIYLFESDELWIEALKATFKPWEDKVTIVRKTIGNENNDKMQSLDDFFKDKSCDNLFLKMDIEGAERDALQGSINIFNTAKNLSFAISTYHLEDDEEVIGTFLNKNNCTFINQKGYFRHKLRSVVLRGRKK